MKNISLLFIFVLATLTASAHEVRPAYFSVTQLTDSTYQVVWKIPAMGNAIPKIYPVLPENWIITDEQANLLPGNLRRTYTIRVDKNIEGNELYFEGQEKTLIDILVSIKKSDGIQYSAMLKPSNPHYKIPLKPDRFSTIKTYLSLGFEHILLGIDHLLFVLALLLLTKGFGRIVKTITAFTSAHSITLSFATLGFVGLPSAPVEAIPIITPRKTPALMATHAAGCNPPPIPAAGCRVIAIECIATSASVVEALATTSSPASTSRR